MISLTNVSKIYTAGDNSFYAIKELSLSISENEFVAIKGKSGSGKSTLLNLIGTLDAATQGSINIDGCYITNLRRNDLSKFRNEKLGFIFQSFYLEPEYSVYENVELPLILSGSFGRKNKPLVEEALFSVGLSGKSGRKAKALSGGEQQRVAIARAIIKQPKYILADEPCGNLDTENSANIMRILKALHKQGKTVLLVTHDDNDALLAKRIITLSDGRVLKDEANILAD